MSIDSPPPRLRIGHVPGVTVSKWERIWRERFRVPLEVKRVAEADQRDQIVDGGCELCFVRGPIDRRGLHLIPLYDEVPVAWFSKDHFLAAADELTTADLAQVSDQPVLTNAEPPAIELASYGAAVLRVPMSIARWGSRKDLVWRPIVDAEPTSIGLAWLQTNDHALIDEFIGVVRGRSTTSSRTIRERGAKPQPAAKPSRRRVSRRP